MLLVHSGFDPNSGAIPVFSGSTQRLLILVNTDVILFYGLEDSQGI